MTKTVLVLGATGTQVRCLTRNPSSDKAKALAAKGAQLVKADLTIPSTLPEAFKGVWGVFAVTDFYDTAVLDDPMSEEKQGQHIVEASVAAGVECFLWSTLPSSREISGGKFVTRLYEGKQSVDAVIRDAGLKGAFIRTGNFYENMISRKYAAYDKENDVITMTRPIIGPDAELTSLYVEKDLGAVAKALFDQWDEKKDALDGKYFLASGARETMGDINAVLEKVSGKKVIYKVKPTCGIPDRDIMLQLYNNVGMYPGVDIPTPEVALLGVKLHSAEDFIRESRTLSTVHDPSRTNQLESRPHFTEIPVKFRRMSGKPSNSRDQIRTGGAASIWGRGAVPAVAQPSPVLQPAGLALASPSFVPQSLELTELMVSGRPYYIQSSVSVMSPSDIQDWDPAPEAVDQTASATDDVREATPTDDQDGTTKRNAAKDTAAANAESTERPAKKMKRGKYISRACTSCQQRKIKPSAPRGAQQARQDLRSGPAGGQDPVYYPSNDSINREVLVRLEAVERHLRLMRPPTPDLSRPAHEYASVEDQLKPSAAKLQSALETEGQTFAGEMTMTPTLEEENDPMDYQSSASSAMRIDNTSPASSLLPPATSTSPNDTTGRKGGWFERILSRHGVMTDEKQCRYHLQVFMDEVHPMYPVVHPPAVWDIFNEMWQHPAISSSVESAQSEQLRVSVALVCFCLALGRCSMSARMSDRSGVESSGWSLYSVGMSLLGDLLETSNTAIKSLLMLQVLTVRIIYMFRLDANQKAARVHALTVSVAQTIGLHRQSTIEGMPAYYNQLYSRAWWSLYLLDRRLALESGKPYLIQDSNVDTALPLDLSDEWMTRFASRKEKIADLQHEIVVETARDSSPSCIPYVIAMVRYCRIAGKTWEVLYGVKSSTASMSAMIQYVDTAIGKLLNTIPICLKYDLDAPYEAQFSTRTRWQVKQTFLFNNCCTYLRLLIRRPLLPSSSTIYYTEEDDLESSIECASLAARILTTHQNIQDDGLKYSFALSHYVTSCALVMVGLVSREPGSKRRYGALILAATQCLNEYCQRIWVSGKMMRCVSRLSRLVGRVLASDSQGGLDLQSTSGMRRKSLSDRLTQHLTPPSTEDQDLIRCRTETSSMYRSQLKDMGTETTQRVQRNQEVDCYSFNTDTLGTMPESSTAGFNKLPTSWTGDSSLDRRNSWIMSDFNFETLGERFGPNDGELATFVENDSLDFTRGMGMPLTTERGGTEARLGTLGINGVFDLDMDMFPTMMNLYGS
ncbi:transcriptional regulatory [Fusarium pseudocircinatum]|uniref:Transcriptional regulatory n=1 Tax=Fusarium pseudocircinatum TaxID=56676 RepID=A0A8H5KRD6_9HYPO|nr:transcriptional regulatory [Fusarium pseudocircinatum]